MVRTNVYTSEDISMCEKDENNKRRIDLRDVISYMESSSQYSNSKLLHTALLADAKNN